MGWNSWLLGRQDEISFRLVSPQWPASANPVKVTLYHESGRVSVATQFGQHDSGYWEKTFDTVIYLNCKVIVSAGEPGTVEVKRHFHIIENTHVYACKDDPTTFITPWKSLIQGPATFDTPFILPPGAVFVV